MPADCTGDGRRTARLEPPGLRLNRPVFLYSVDLSNSVDSVAEAAARVVPQEEAHVPDRTIPPTKTPVWLQPQVVFAVVLLLCVVRGWFASQTDLVADEGYYTLWSFHLGAGYLDHPPGVAWVIALGRWLLGENSLGVRLVALLSPLVISAALYRIGLILFDATVAGLSVLWYNLTVGIALSLLATPDVPSTLFWALAAWGVAEFIRRGNPNWWLLVGLVAGLGVLGKYTNLFFGLGLLLVIFTSRERLRWLLLPQLWVGGMIALLVISPNLWWNAEHGWATAVFQGRRIVDDLYASDPQRNYFDLIVGQALFLGPITLALYVAGTFFWLSRWRHPDHSRLALPVLSGLPALVYFLYHASHSHVEANWLLPLWPMMTLVAAWFALRALPGTKPVRYLGPVAVYSQVAFGLLVVGFLHWMVLTHPPQFADIDRSREMHGWAETRAELDRLAAEHGAGWIGVAENYGLIGPLSTYGNFAGSDVPVITIGDLDRFVFRPATDRSVLSSPGLLVRDGAAVLPNDLFGRIEDLGTVERRLGSEVVGRYSVLKVSEPTAAFFAISR